MDCTVDLLLSFVWDKTASGTAWSNTEKGLILADLFLVYVWDKTASGTARSNTED